MIPASRDGWAIDLGRQLLHRRYAPHARGLPRMRTEAEVRTYLGDNPRACPALGCWPPAATPKQVKATRPRPRSAGRTTRGLLDQRELLDAPEILSGGPDQAQADAPADGPAQDATEREPADGATDDADVPES